MHKSELIDYIAKAQNCPKVEAEKIINVFTETVMSVLAEGKDIALLGFGKFHTTKVPAKDGRNPRTGAPIKIQAYTQPRFGAGQVLKDACNGKIKVSKPKKETVSQDKKKGAVKKAAK